jgi:DMSO/TMAO reductase YedYZ molybdopterin-dependent catalytic subunit
MVRMLGRVLRARLRTVGPPPGPARRSFWRSPVRGPWLASVLGSALLVAIPVVAVTGLLSYVAYSPQLGDNGRFWGDPGVLDAFVFTWPTTPSWLYAATQGLHVTIGIAAVPIVLAKLWAVIPKLFEWPPLRSPAHALERVSLALLVGGVLFEFATGILNIQIYYPWKFSFLEAHYYGAWVFLGAFVMHVAVKLPIVRTQLRRRRIIDELLVDLESTRPEHELHAETGALTTEPPTAIATQPSAPTISRRGLLAAVGGSSLALLVLTAGQAIGGPLRRVALLAPHGGSSGPGPNDFQINKTAASVGIDARALTGWKLELAGARTLTLTRDALLAMPQHTYDLPIACVEGWTTTQRWTGVRLSDLARLAGSAGDQVEVQSLQRAGSFAHATLSREAVADDRSLLALRVNDADLSLDHGFPARVIVPALPGVHCTKWVRAMTFGKA